MNLRVKVANEVAVRDRRWLVRLAADSRTAGTSIPLMIHDLLNHLPATTILTVQAPGNELTEFMLTDAAPHTAKEV